jgi:periplasmic protein TonB
MADLSANLGPQTPGADPAGRLARLNAPLHESGVKGFLSNLREFLFERPKRVRGAQETPFDMPDFGAGFGSNLRELLHHGPHGRVNSELLVNWGSGAGISGGLWRNLWELIFPPKLPALKTTSAPVAVKDIWSKDTQFTRVQTLSLAIHVFVAVLIIVPIWSGLFQPPTTQAKTMIVTQLDSPYLPKLAPAPKKAGGGGGGGAHEVLPASKGKLPKFSWTQLTPPSVKPPENPKMAATPTVLGPPELKLPSPNMPNWGDPLSKVVNDSSGPGSGGGIGSGSGGGVGSGNGRGVGPGQGWGTGGGYPSAGYGGYGEPVCLYCPQAQFSDEAVKAKFQGVVLVSVVVMPDGRATDIQVVRPAGLGLDEKAIEAVRNWRFTPAKGPDGRPAAVHTIIEITFRLY